MKGKVIFIGGGPGDPELLTIKADKAIKKADVIIYAGSLVNKEVLKGAGDDAEIHNSASMTLSQILELMEKSVQEDKLVARVHTGDPSIYGAIGEQIQHLKKKNIPYQIIPGVSSVFAAAATLERELTLPELSQTVIITRPEGRTPKPPLESLSSLAEHQATMCIFLGVQSIDAVVRELKEHYSGDTPVAVVQKASWDDEKIVQGNLNNIASQVKTANIKKTAIIVVGKVLEPGDIRPSKLYDKDFKHQYRK